MLPSPFLSLTTKSSSFDTTTAWSTSRSHLC